MLVMVVLGTWLASGAGICFSARLHSDRQSLLGIIVLKILISEVPKIV